MCNTTTSGYIISEYCTCDICPNCGKLKRNRNIWPKPIINPIQPKHFYTQC